MLFGKKKKLVALVLIFIVLGVINWWPRVPRNARSVLENADTYELLSLDPERPETASPTDFCGYRVLGSLIVADKSTRQQLNQSLASAVLVDWFIKSIPRCFNPRHGIRVTHNGQTDEFLICFECEQIYSTKGAWLTDSSPLQLFNKVLTDANIPLPKEAE